MALEKNSSKVRNIKEGYGINGVQLNLSMAHIYSLMDLRAQNKAMLGLSQNSSQTQTIEKTLEVLNFIIGDIRNPMDENLWKSEE